MHRTCIVSPTVRWRQAFRQHRSEGYENKCTSSRCCHCGTAPGVEMKARISAAPLQVRRHRSAAGRLNMEA